MANYLNVPSAATGSGATTPHQAGLVVSTGSVDARVQVAPENWGNGTTYQTLVNAQHSAYLGGQDRWDFMIHPTGYLDYIWRDSSAAYNEATSTVTTGFANGSKHWVRVLHTISAGTVDFYTSTDGSSWTSLGSQITGKPTLAIYSLGGWPPVGIGATRGAIDGDEYLFGKDQTTQVRIDGATILNMDWTTATVGSGPWTAGTGETWTAFGTASVIAEPVGSRDVVGWTTRSGGY